MTVLITLTVAGADSGPFDLFSNLNGYTGAFATGVSKSALLAGYASSAVPDYTTIIRVMSVGDCNNYIDCFGNPQSLVVPFGVVSDPFCAFANTVDAGGVAIGIIGPCTP